MFLVPPCCLHLDRRPDPTVSGSHSPYFVFCFWKSLFCSCFFVCPAAWKSPFVIPTSPLQVSVGFWRERHESLKFAAVRGSPKPAVRGRSKPPSAAHPSRPFAGDRWRRLRLTQADRSWEIDAAIRGSPKHVVCGRSTSPLAAHPSRPFMGDWCR